MLMGIPFGPAGAVHWDSRLAVPATQTSPGKTAVAAKAKAKGRKPTEEENEEESDDEHSDYTSGEESNSEDDGEDSEDEEGGDQHKKKPKPASKPTSSKLLTPATGGATQHGIPVVPTVNLGYFLAGPIKPTILLPRPPQPPLPPPGLSPAKGSAVTSYHSSSGSGSAVTGRRPTLTFATAFHTMPQHRPHYQHPSSNYPLNNHI